MKKFSITAEVVTKYEIDVKAKSVNEAITIANRTKLNDWIAVEDVNFELIACEEIEEVAL